MNVEIKFGTRKELRAWLHRQKKNGNAVRYVAVDDPKTDQRVMLVLEDEALKVVRPSHGMKQRLEIRESAREDLIEAMKTGEHAAEVAEDLRSHARVIMLASDRKLMEAASVMSREIGEDMAMVSMESLAGYLQGMAELISQREEAEGEEDHGAPQTDRPEGWR